MTTKEIIARSVRSEDYNSNNAWGFGGKAGKFYYFNNPELRMFVGKFSFRHAPDEKAEQFAAGHRSISKAGFIELLNTPE